MQELKTLGFILTITLAASAQLYIFMLLWRIKIIYTVFCSEHVTPKVNSYTIYIIAFVLYVVSVFPYAFYFFSDTPWRYRNFTFNFAPIFVVTFVIYPFWIGYYTWKCRETSYLYSDFYTMLRNSLFMSVMGLVALGYYMLDYSAMAADLLTQIGFQVVVIYCFSELFCCLLYCKFQRQFGNWTSSEKSRSSETTKRTFQEQPTTGVVNSSKPQLQDLDLIDHATINPHIITKKKTEEGGVVLDMQSNCGDILDIGESYES
eukprot:Awhi_evm2s8057